MGKAAHCTDDTAVHYASDEVVAVFFSGVGLILPPQPASRGKTRTPEEAAW